MATKSGSIKPSRNPSLPREQSSYKLSRKERHMLEALLNELRQEGAITERLLERVPGEKLTWKAHPKAMSLGQLASHVATIPGGITGLAQGDGFDTANANPEVPQPDSLEAILISFEESLAAADQYLSNLDSDTASQIWRLTSKG